VLRRPWDLLRFAKDLLRADLDAMLEGTAAGEISASVVGEGRALVHPSARLLPGVVLDVEEGPVVIDAEAVVRPNASLAGPTYIGRGAQVKDGSVIRPHTAIGPVCKVGGEVGASILQAHSNKSHDGYLGDSYLGEWVNLGAGTITSNLKNTYGPVRAQQWPAGDAEDTGLTHLGSILGDHVKSAIGTRLLTGTIAHTGAMIALSAFAPKTIERFAFLTDEGPARYDIERFLDVARRVMQRRDGDLPDALAERLRHLHAQAQH
jgi:UDP-N-acetylglucosamine diphosphorylase/glucosamine-1-phosphate N-acetyltransferase